MPAPSKQKEFVKPFEFHGVVFEKETASGQLIADCPFTGKKEKFYLNPENGLWDSKTAGLSGNVGGFLEAIFEQQLEAYREDDAVQKALAVSRKLPRSAFEGLVGWNGRAYTLLVRNREGHAQDLRVWSPGGKMLSTSGCATGLFGMEQLGEGSEGEIFICEGEWDAIALRYLLKKLGVAGVVVGVPGANTFKEAWIEAFQGRKVQCLYDNDAAGEQGELLAMRRLTGAARKIGYIQWPLDAPAGFDVRDWIVAGLKLKVPKKCWSRLRMLFIPNPRTKQKAVVEHLAVAAEGEGPRRKIGWKELYGTFGKWLQLRNEDAIAVVCGTVLCNQLAGDPLWLFLVGPPGSLKSELCMAVQGAQKTHALSSLTPAALVSGAQWSGDEDPSLMPKLNGKVLIIKDFTTVLVMNAAARDEIFGQLRDAYDGRFEKQFGNGIRRSYEAHFGIIAGVTPQIDHYSALSGLGERFMKYRLEKNLVHENEETRIMRALTNVSHEVDMRQELQQAAAAFLDQVVVKDPPDFEPGIREQVVSLAMLTARLRGVVNREAYNQQMQTSKASFEVGTRIAKQLTKLAMGLAYFYGSRKIGVREYRIVAQVALSSCPDKSEEVMRTVYEQTPGGGTIRTVEVVKHAEQLTQSTTFRALQDLQMLGLMEQKGRDTKYQWALPEKIRKLIETSRCYEHSPR